MYSTPSTLKHNKWIEVFCSSDNKQALPLFVSLLNVVCAYNPVGIGVPYNYIFFEDNKESLVEVSCQLLIVVLDQNNVLLQEEYEIISGKPPKPNLFLDYLSRIHRDQDFKFMLDGFCRLLNNPIQQTYLPSSMKKITFHQELMILFWRLCDINKKFMFFTLKSTQVSVFCIFFHNLNFFLSLLKLCLNFLSLNFNVCHSKQSLI